MLHDINTFSLYFKDSVPWRDWNMRVFNIDKKTYINIIDMSSARMLEYKILDIKSRVVL